MKRYGTDEGGKKVSVLSAYVGVIVIWSTTPLAIRLSNESFTPIASATLRMLVALVFALGLAFLLQRGGLRLWQHRKVYLAASVGIFPNMPLVYWAAEYIPSGLISVLFGLSPLVTGLAARYILGEGFTARRMLALSVALAGMLVIFLEQMAIGERGIFGVGLMLLSTIIFSISGVYVKHFGSHLVVSPLNQTIGALVYALPGLCICWFVFDGSKPETVSSVSLSAVLYLAVIGSVLGFGAYFYILQRLSVGAVSLIPLVTPGLALILGNIVIHEPLSLQTLLGTALIVSGLAIYDASVLRYVYAKGSVMIRLLSNTTSH